MENSEFLKAMLFRTLRAATWGGCAGGMITIAAVIAGKLWLHGRSGEFWPDHGDAELRTWVKRVQDQSWRDAFIFFKHEDEGKAPQMAKRFLELAA